LNHWRELQKQALTVDWLKKNKEPNPETCQLHESAFEREDADTALASSFNPIGITDARNKRQFV
jgi:hypothetical protein